METPRFRRRPDLIAETVGDGLVIYDPATGQAHALDGVGARVWEALDAQRELSQLAAAAGVADEVVAEAVNQWMQRGLILGSAEVSRRSMLRRTAVAGAAAVAAAPLIETVVIPTAAAHASTLTNSGGGNGNPGPATNLGTISWGNFDINPPGQQPIQIYEAMVYSFTTNSTLGYEAPGTYPIDQVAPLTMTLDTPNSLGAFSVQLTNNSTSETIGITQDASYTLAPGQSLPAPLTLGGGAGQGTINIYTP